MGETVISVGEMVKDWRELRRLSQLDLAVDAEISQKHLSFIESGRSAPSREMLLHLAEHLDVPLRERNAMLLAAGSAPVFPSCSLHDPSLAPAKASVERVLKAHELNAYPLPPSDESNETQSIAATVFGTALEVTLSELTVEAFYPAR